MSAPDLGCASPSLSTLWPFAHASCAIVCSVFRLIVYLVRLRLAMLLSSTLAS